MGWFNCVHLHILESTGLFVHVSYGVCVGVLWVYVDIL